jgi:phosphoglycolate phosphatase-like HAD superfamily hydrolase
MPADTRQALAFLQKAGIRIVVSSNNGTDNVDAFARDSRFPFDLVLGYGGGLAKGRPHVRRAMTEFGVAPFDMLFVGDSLHDGDIAGNEGMPFVGVAGTFSKERFTLRFPTIPVVQRFADIVGLIAV